MILFMRTWCVIRNFASQNFCLTPSPAPAWT